MVTVMTVPSAVRVIAAKSRSPSACLTALAAHSRIAAARTARSLPSSGAAPFSSTDTPMLAAVLIARRSSSSASAAGALLSPSRKLFICRVIRATMALSVLSGCST